VPLIDLPLGWAVGLDVLVWAVAGFVAGYLAYRTSVARLSRDGVLTRLRSFEHDGRWYERRLRIKSWKDRLPEAGAFFAGGFSKRSLRASDPDTLERFVAETRRAERTHWWLVALGPVFFLWNPWWLALVMVAYAVVANLPCLLVQRYNRARLQRVLARRAGLSAT
jgi:glycosyl-4,4'-diaponeurosporenoate acyltransferase